MTTVAPEELPEHLRGKAKIVDTDVSRVVDYFDVKETHFATLPDGVQTVEVKVLTEGERRRYLNQTNREVKMNSRTKDLIMKSSVGDDEEALIKVATVGWNVMRGGASLPFTPNNLDFALNAWPPAAWRPVLKKIREVNEWLLGDEENLEALEEEYAELGERISKIKASAGKE